MVDPLVRHVDPHIYLLKVKRKHTDAERKWQSASDLRIPPSCGFNIQHLIIKKVETSSLP